MSFCTYCNEHLVQIEIEDDGQAIVNVDLYGDIVASANADGGIRIELDEDGSFGTVTFHGNFIAENNAESGVQMEDGVVTVFAEGSTTRSCFSDDTEGDMDLADAILVDVDDDAELVCDLAE